MAVTRYTQVLTVLVHQTATGGAFQFTEMSSSSGVPFSQELDAFYVRVIWFWRTQKNHAV